MDRLSVNHTETEHELELVLSTKGLGVFDDIGSCTLCCIVSYLSIADVTALQLTNKYFRSFCSSKLVWSLIHRKNFQVESVDSPSRSISSPQCSSTNQECTKEQFIERYRNYSIRIQQGKGWDVEAQEETLRAARVHGMENFLDMTQVRLIIPLILASVILTITLFARKVDGLEISYWVCFVPLLVALIYMSLSFYLLKVLHKYEGSPKLILRGIWDNFRGPVMFVYREILGSHLRLVYAMLGLLAVFIIQVLLVATKLSTTTPSELNAHYLPWPVVFIPIWLCLVLYCALPLFVRNIDAGAFLSLMSLFVVPTLIFFVCLTVKLSGAQENSPQRKIRLALMLIPFWILEGVVMLGSLLFLLIGIHRYRRGLERLWEYAAVFLVTWGSLLPFVLFQALLCARDDYQHDYYGHSRRHEGPSATETVAPLLILLGWLWFVTTVISFSMKTAYQEARDRVFHDAAGLRVMYQF